MTPAELIVLRNLAIVPCIVAVLMSLSVALCREFVKNDLRGRLCRPISVRWRPFLSTRLMCAFKVVYADLEGDVHRATCKMIGYSRKLRWFDDEIIGHISDSEA
jgi:hypothetical protein